jgi:hypothetical protein
VQEQPRAAGSTIQPGNLAAELRELDAEKAHADALAAALRSVLQRLGPTASPAEVEAARVVVTDA